MSRKAQRACIKLTYEQKEQLIGLVEEHRFLYDVTAEDHRNKLVITNTWKKIARTMNVDGLSCKYTSKHHMQKALHISVKAP